MKQAKILSSLKLIRKVILPSESYIVCVHFSEETSIGNCEKISVSFNLHCWTEFREHLMNKFIYSLWDAAALDHYMIIMQDSQH